MKPPGSSPPSPSADSLRVVLAAGGTGGHVMPALATAAALAERVSVTCLVIGSRRDAERRLRRLVPYPVVEVDVEGLAGVGWGRRLLRIARLPLAVVQAGRHLASFDPRLVIAAGGYVAGPVGLAAWLRGMPLLVLEQNVVPGLTTRWLTPLAAAVAVSHPSTAEALGARAVDTGNPVRRELLAATEGRRDRADGRPFRLLVLGGSQGARGLNALVRDALPRIVEAGVSPRVRHQTGPRDADELRAAYDDHGLEATVAPFFDDMADAYGWADLVIARAGATTVAELAACGLPSILVPFPHAAERHQLANARSLVDAGAARLVEEDDGSPRLAEIVVELARHRERRREMARAAAGCGRPDAAERVADIALSLVDAPAPAASAPGAGAETPC